MSFEDMNWSRWDTDVRAFRCGDCGEVVPFPKGRPTEPHGCAKEPREDEAVTYTTAPADYDWFGTRTVDPAAGTTDRGKAVRKVAGPADMVDGQRTRYGSGLHMSVDEAEWRKLVSYGLVRTA